MTTPYCTDADLEKIRPNILQLGISTWDTQIEEAGLIIDRALDANWYRAHAADSGLDPRITPFDREKLSKTELVRLGSYKTLELAYMFLMKDHVDDAFEKQRKLFQSQYREELDAVLAAGLEYDFSADSTLTYDEKQMRKIRRLERV
jgi:hypothetical protein